MTAAAIIDLLNVPAHIRLNNTPQATGRKAELNTGGLLFAGPFRNTGEAHAV